MALEAYLNNDKSIRPNPKDLDHTSSGGGSSGESLSFPQKAIKILDILSSFKLFDMLSSPVDAITFSDYHLKIPNPLDFSAIRSNFSGKKSTYASPDLFARDVRRVLGNCLRYNYLPSGLSIRQEARKILYRFESEWAKQFPDCKQVIYRVVPLIVSGH